MTTVLTIPTVETERLRLRAPKPSDFEAFATFRASDRTAHVGGPQDRKTAFGGFMALTGHWAFRGFGRWMVADRGTDAPLGVVGPFYPLDWPEPEIAWSVFAEAEGRSIAYEAAKAARAWAYAEAGWTTAISMIDIEAARSIALAERLGCRRDPDYHHPEYGLMRRYRHPGPEELA